MDFKFRISKKGAEEVISKIFNHSYRWYSMVHTAYWGGLIYYCILAALGYMSQTSIYGVAILTAFVFATSIAKNHILSKIHKSHIDVSASFKEKIVIDFGDIHKEENYNDICYLLNSKNYFIVMFDDFALPLDKENFGSKENLKKFIKIIKEESKINSIY